MSTVKRADVKVRRIRKVKVASHSSGSSDDSSCEDDSCDDVSQEEASICEERKPSTSITSIPVVKAEVSSVSTKKQRKQKKHQTIDLTTEDHDDAIKPFLHLVGTTHYDPDVGEEDPDAGVFKVDSVVVEHYKDGDEVVVYRSKYNENTRTWNPVNMEDPIRVADVVKYGNSKRYNTKMNRIMSSSEC